MTAPFTLGVVGHVVSARRPPIGETIGLLMARIETFSASGIALTESTEPVRNGRPTARPADHSLARP